MGYQLRRVPRRLRQKVGRRSTSAIARAAGLGPRAEDRFEAVLARTGDIEVAAVAVSRTLIRRGTMGRARTFAQVLQKNPGTTTAGDVSRALIALRDGEPEIAWPLLAAHDPQRMLALAPEELFRAGFLAAPDAAKALVARLRGGEFGVRIGPRAWRGIAQVTFAVGLEDDAAWALNRAVAGAGPRFHVVEDAEWLLPWFGRRSDPAVAPTADGISVAVPVEEQPQRSASQGSPHNAEGRRAVVASLARHGIAAHEVSRDAPSYATVPQGTWLIVTGRLPRPLFGIRTDLPYDARYRPIFASLRIDDPDVLTSEVLAQLRDCGPVGCADWDTYYLLRAADVPAFRAEAFPDAVDVIVEEISSGKDAADVYRVWREASASAVSAGKQLDRDATTPPHTGFDLAAACEEIRSQAVTVERSEPAPAGQEINLEFSLDGNLKRHMVVVLDSIVRRASRPIRLFVLCRDHGRADFDRLAELFPTVSFEWLPTDHVDYGVLSGMVQHITIATMDRLLLPELLPDVDRVIHHDLDAVCLTDLADLDGIDLHGHPIAAVTSPRLRYRSGLGGFRGTAFRLRKEGLPDRARELIQRTHLRHKFDFDAFNAGVMVLDLRRMRADGFCREFFPYAELFGMNDQAILNAYTGADRLDLDASWNWCPRLEDMAQPRIAHWSGPVKPWGDAWVNGQELWTEAEALAATRTRTPRATAPAT